MPNPGPLNPYELWSKLLVSPLISRKVVPYTIPHVTPFKEFRRELIPSKSCPRKNVPCQRVCNDPELGFRDWGLGFRFLYLILLYSANTHMLSHMPLSKHVEALNSDFLSFAQKRILPCLELQTISYKRQHHGRL